MISRTLQDHPVPASALGMTALIMKSETLLSASMMAILFCLVLVLSAVSVTCLRRLIPAEHRLVYILVITATWVAVLDMVTASLFYGMRLHLGIYLPLLALNGLILMVLESRALKSPLPVLLPELTGTGLMVSMLLVSTGLLREWLASGALLTDMDLIGLAPLWTTGGAGSYTLPLAGTVTGGFIIFGCVLALCNAIFRIDNRQPTDSSGPDGTGATRGQVSR